MPRLTQCHHLVSTTKQTLTPQQICINFYQRELNIKVQLRTTSKIDIHCIVLWTEKEKSGFLAPAKSEINPTNSSSKSLIISVSARYWLFFYGEILT